MNFICLLVVPFNEAAIFLLLIPPGSGSSLVPCHMTCLMEHHFTCGQTRYCYIHVTREVSIWVCFCVCDVCYYVHVYLVCVTCICMHGGTLCHENKHHAVQLCLLLAHHLIRLIT